ncbi:MAG: 16S rRNA (guanine(966)-N(2))-methyltransferase RsmD [Adlercreutzia sp.]|uniref:16S rRNA (guanine(966)-N(2))-methyltransferase RsmD n=1 Tax=uncultured Adlercreutzia sp. TaxID=875803 RepID=UPI00216EE9AA|nr:16S rRNA (guanine(966)-N(2))-methyltransferase RsmD [uncultured Adlercreutzia sp.]MCI8425083.1 16S rRNA (guanine(966)-N(2))-methyltransferase RsmD [Adlercreutzia sp.]
MRIIAGEHRGRRLEAPKGQGTRPTTDRVRESLMSALVSARGGLDDAVVLDAFAGSGALGLEALSRGASCAVFCERDREAAAVVERNIAACRYGREAARVLRTDVLKRGAAAPGRPFDLVFLDPPYATDPGEVFGLVARLDGAGALARDVIVSYEHDVADDKAVADGAAAAGFRIASHRHFGDTVIDLLERLCTD